MKQQDLAKNNHGFAAITIVILVLILTAAFFAFKYYQLKNLNKPVVSNSTTNVNLPTPSPDSLYNESRVFLFKFELKSIKNLPPVAENSGKGYHILADYLNNLLGLPDKTITSLVFDIRNNSPYGQVGAVYSIPFYTVLDQPVKLKTSYSDDYLTVYPQVVKKEIVPYLSNMEYCEKDVDCSIRANMCVLGAFNNYQRYTDPPWGCGPAGYKEKYSWYKYGEVDEKLKCTYELKFNSAKCVSNLCTESDYQKVCSEAI
jgi:hypothetical protein